MTEPATINRFAVVLIPTEAYLEWHKSCPDGDPNTTLADVQDEPTVYLIPESNADLDSHLRRYYKTIFTEELGSWCTDPSLWPKDLSFATFKEFYTIHLSEMVSDLGSGRIVKDDEDD